MSKCERSRKRLAEYSVGGLGGWRRARVEAHLETCAACRAELAALERTASLVTQVGLDAAPDHWAAVRPQLRPGLRPVTARPRLRLAYALATATFAVLAIAFGWLLRPSPVAAPPAVTPVVRADDEMKASMQGHLKAAWSAPLGDEAALGLRMAALEGEG